MSEIVVSTNYDPANVFISIDVFNPIIAKTMSTL